MYKLRNVRFAMVCRIHYCRTPVKSKTKKSKCCGSFASGEIWAGIHKKSHTESQTQTQI